MIEKRSKGHKVAVEEAPEESAEVVDLMEALEASVKGEAGPALHAAHT